MAIQLILLKFQLYIYIYIFFYNEISPKLRHFFLIKKLLKLACLCKVH